MAAAACAECTWIGCIARGRHAAAAPAAQRRQHCRPLAVHASQQNEQAAQHCADRGSAWSTAQQHAEVQLPRRSMLMAAAAVTLAGAAGVTAPAPAAATQLPEALDRAWEGLGGGPADLVFPDNFLGVWDVESVLTSVETPLGPEMVPDMRVVQRAQQEDLNAVVRYQVAFLRNQRGEVVPDRSFNTASLMQTYMGMPVADVQRRIEWNPDDPNVLQLTLPGGLAVSTRVTRRLEETDFPADRLSTSEYFQQLISTPQAQQPKVKASQCFTKYHWRSAEAAGASGGGVQVVATQVVSDYLTAYNGATSMMEARGRPVVVYTYRMTFRRPAADAAAAVAAAAPPPAVAAS